MATRGPGAIGGATSTERSLGQLARGLEALAHRVRKLEAIVSNQSVPADFRLDSVEDEEGKWIVVECVSTGNTQRIAGPL
jgi:hypothetical protein